MVETAGIRRKIMLEGIIDNLKVIKSTVFKYNFMPESDGNDSIIQSKKLKTEYIRKYKKSIKDGEILRYAMLRQISPLASYKSFDDYINNQREKEVDRLNKEYYGKGKYLKLKQCMSD
jgi:hypothetical protein